MNCDMNIRRNYAPPARRRPPTSHGSPGPGRNERYPAGVPAKVSQLIERELAIIEELNYAAYFLTVWDLVRFARAAGILCQGRGSAANSAVCYCLGVTAVDPGSDRCLCSSGSFPRIATKRPTSTSTSSISAGKK